MIGQSQTDEATLCMENTVKYDSLGEKLIVRGKRHSFVSETEDASWLGTL